MGKRLRYSLSLLGDSVIAAMIGTALTVILAGYFKIDTVNGAVYTTALVSVFALFALSYSKASGWVTFLGMVLACLVAVIFGWDPISYGKEMLNAISEGTSLSGYYGFFACIVCVLFVLLTFAVSHTEAGGAVMTAVSLVVLTLGWVFDDFTVDRHLILLIAGIGALFFKSTRFHFSVWRPLLSVTLIAALASGMIAPVEGVTVPKLEEYAHNALEWVMRVLSIDDNDLEERRSFTIASGGWISQNERIGGDANPTDDRVLSVKSEEDTLYLRGAVRYVYNGSAWVDESNEMRAGKIKRYMLSGIDKLIYKSEYERAFNLDKDEAKAYFREASCEVEILADTSFWTIFAPDRITDVKVEGEYGVYYNNVGEMFLNRPMLAGDFYKIEYLTPAHKAENTEEMLETLSHTEDPGYRAALILNRDIPSGIDSAVFDLVHEITQNARTPYQKASAICAYLKNNGVYTLKSDFAPEETDAVSYFLMNGMEGYCVHFASSMALLARIAGLPARYAEGYLAETDEDGNAVLTGRDAHAWAEVYFEGYGWMTFDATPSEDTDREHGDEEDEPEKDDTPPKEPSDVTATPTPTPTPAPTPKPSDMPQTPQEQNWDAPTPTPTIPPHTPESNTPEGRNDGYNDGETLPDKDENGLWKLIVLMGLFVLIVLIALCAFVRRRLLRTNPMKASEKIKNPEDRLMLWYRAMLTALEYAHVKYENGETPVTFAKRARSMDACSEAFQMFSDAVSESRYSGRNAQTDAYAIAREAYEDIVSRLSAASKLRWRIRRVISGIGKLDPVP